MIIDYHQAGLRLVAELSSDGIANLAAFVRDFVHLSREVVDAETMEKEAVECKCQV